MKVLRTASLGSNFTGSYKKQCNVVEKRGGTKPVKLGVSENLNGDEEIVNDISEPYKHSSILAIKNIRSGKFKFHVN